MIIPNVLGYSLQEETGNGGQCVFQRKLVAIINRLIEEPIVSSMEPQGPPNIIAKLLSSVSNLAALILSRKVGYSFFKNNRIKYLALVFKFLYLYDGHRYK